MNKAVIISLLSAWLLITGCSEQPETDWYDHVSQGTESRDAFIEHQVEAGVSSEEARQISDLRFFTERTINMSRRDGIPEEYRENLGR